MLSWSNSGQPRLPALWRGPRRPLLVALVGAGLGQAAAAAVIAIATPRLLAAQDPAQQRQLAAVLLVLALVVGGLRVAERVLGERLGQRYVHEVRLHLVRAALVGRGPSVGVTIARATNDLTSVRNWIVLGIVPLVVGIPLLVGSLLALALLSPLLAVVVALPLLALVLLLAWVAGALRDRTARLRRARGRLAGRLADTVAAQEGIALAGGVERELRRIEDDSEGVMASAVSRATASGWVRGAAASVALLTMVSIGAVGALAGLDTTTIATAFIVVGMMATPVTELGRLTEYRQSYRVAERILAPEVARAQQHARRRREAASQAPRAARDGRVHLADLSVAGRSLPELVAEPGDVIVPCSGDPEVLQGLAAMLRHPHTARGSWLTIGGEDLTQAAPERRRHLVGYAAAHLPLERGTIARAVRYRRPDLSVPARSALAAVGLADVIDGLDRGERTQLRHGGEPLTPEQRVRLVLARAWYGDPPLVVIDRVDTALDADGRRLLARKLRCQPGVTVLFTDRPEELAPHHRRWDLDGCRASLPAPRLVAGRN